MDDKKYFHELHQDEINTLIETKVTFGTIMKIYLQPEWCNYPEALDGDFGCWSLMDLCSGGKREKVSLEYCKNCDEFKK